MGSHKAWAYYLEGMPLSADARKFWLLDTKETVETTLNEDERTIEDAYKKTYGRELDTAL